MKIINPFNALILSTTIVLAACSTIDPKKVVSETKTYGFETSSFRVGSVTTKYETEDTKKENITKIDSAGKTRYYIIATILVLILFLILINL